MSSTVPAATTASLSMFPLSRVAGVPEALWIVAGFGGALAGGIFALSPLGAALSLLLVLGIRRAIAGTGTTERRWLLSLLGAALLVRVLAIAALALTTDLRETSFHTFFGDGQYALERSLWLRNTMLGIPVAPTDFAEAFTEYGRSSHYYPLAWLQVIFGPAAYALHLFCTACYLLGAVMMFRQVRRSYGAVAAFLGLAFILLLPTLMLWSISPLKESVYFSTASIAMASVIRMFRARWWGTTFGAAVLVAAALVATATLRAGGFAIVSGGIAGGLILAVALRHRWIATTAFILVPVALAGFLMSAPVQEAVMRPIRLAVATHIGHVLTPGSSYKLLEPEFYEVKRLPSSLTHIEAIRYLAGAVSQFIVMPKPWAPVTRNDVAIIPQQLLWFALFVCAVPGVVAGIRRDPLLTALLVGNVLVGVAVIAPASGNVGTLIRHRDMIVPFVAWLGALGAAVTIARSADPVMSPKKEG